MPCVWSSVLVLATPLGFFLRKKTNILRGLLTRRRGREVQAQDGCCWPSACAASSGRGPFPPWVAPRSRESHYLLGKLPAPASCPPVFAQGLALQKLKPAARAACRPENTPAGAAQALPSMGRTAAGGASRRR